MITLLTMNHEKIVRKGNTKTTKNDYLENIFQHTCAGINFHLEILIQKSDRKFFCRVKCWV